MTLAEFRDYYQVPAYAGHRVTVDGMPGKIVGVAHGYLSVRFCEGPGPIPCHPRWRVAYPDAPGGPVVYGD
jgi:hypothetical protein